MNDEQLKELLKGSILTAPEGVTDKIMNGIKAEKDKQAPPNWTILLLAAACLLILSLSLVIQIPELELFSYHIRIHPIWLNVVSVLFVLFELNELHGLHIRQQQMQEAIQ